MPVNQAAERIVFSFDRPAKKVTAVVEILYQGDAAKFAWVLPVPGIPQVGVSTSAMLDRLQAQTNPVYQVQRDFGQACRGGSPNAGSSGPVPAPSVPAAEANKPNVAVLAAGAVGPYVYEVIQVNPALSDPAMVAIEWLKTNGYEVGALGADVLRPYLRDKLNLIAFKLAKNRSAGSIRPVMLTYDSDRPMIPIRPTAVAANENMGILVWVLSANRAVPVNYKSLELNEALIDWFMPNATYNVVVTEAANQAGGQGFVTELATTTGNGQFANNLFNERFAIQTFRQAADALDIPELVARTVETFSAQAQGNFGGPFASRPGSGRVALDGVSDVLANNLTLPPGVTVDAVLTSPRCYFAAFRKPGAFYCDGMRAPEAVIELTGFDKAKFLADVEKLVIAPLEATAKLFVDQAYLTRLYTTLSASEMTLDPEFDLNSELGDVSNQHSVTLKYAGGCGDVNGAWEATFGGIVVKGMGTTWPFHPRNTPDMPANRRVVQMGMTGPGMVVADNTEKIAAAVKAPRPTGTGGAPGTGAPPPAAPADDDGCSMGGQTGDDAANLLFLAPFAWLLWRRRTRRG